MKKNETSFSSETRRDCKLSHTGVCASECHPEQVAGEGIATRRNTLGRGGGKAVGERFLLKDADFRAWRWLEAFG